MLQERIEEERFIIEKDISDKTIEFKKWYSRVKYGVDVSDEGEVGDIESVAKYNAEFNKSNTPDILTIDFSDLFDDLWVQYQVFIIDYRNMGGEDMGGWAAGQIRTKTGKEIRIRRDWRLPYEESFDMTEQVKEAKKIIKDTIVKILIEAIDEKINSGIDLTKYQQDDIVYV